MSTNDILRAILVELRGLARALEGMTAMLTAEDLGAVERLVRRAVREELAERLAAKDAEPRPVPAATGDATDAPCVEDGSR